MAVIALFTSCGKDENPVSETKQGVSLEFVKNNTLTTGQVTENSFNINVVMIWKSDGKDFKYNGISDGLYAYDNVSKTSLKADYSYTNIKSKTIDLPVGKYFITIVTDNTEVPKLAYSYTTFIVSKSDYVKVKKNVSGMASLTYTTW